MSPQSSSPPIVTKNPTSNINVEESVSENEVNEEE